jgi:peroxiredoxin
LPSTIEQVHREYKDLGLVVYAVNIEEHRTTVASFVQKHKLMLPVLLDPDGDASAAYHITATPTAFLIGRDGKLVAKAIGTKSWTSPQGRALLQRLLVP